MLVQFEQNKRETKVERLRADLVVAGGGLSGVCAAITAARQGISVVLIQDRPVLGGNASSEIRVWALGATSHAGNNNRWAREGGLIDEIMVENTFRNKEGNPLFFDALLIEKVMAEPNIRLLLNTQVFDVEKLSSTKIGLIVAFNSQNSTRYEVEGVRFCDATGDGLVAYMSGASFRMGAEDRSEFGEGFAPSKEYGALLGHTIFLYPKMTDQPVAYVPPAFALEDITRIPKYKNIRPSNVGVNYWWFEYGGLLDTITDTEEIKQELWKVVFGAWDYIKNSGEYPEAENMTLEWVGVIPGKRESRRFVGHYTLTQHDFVQQTHFPDAVSFGGWAVDLHPAEGIYSDLPSCSQFHSKGIYSIPYRCMVSQDIDNLFIAGRIISATHVAFGTTRVMITAAHGGQAIGMAAALCSKYECNPADLIEPEKMKMLQNELNQQGQSIPHLPMLNDRNLAARARVWASSTLMLSGFAFDGEYRRAEFSMAQLLPMKKGVAHTFTFEVKADKPTPMEVELMVADKPYNYTPDQLLEKIVVTLCPGEQRIDIPFNATVPTDCYAFVIVRRNEHLSVRMSSERVTGTVSVFNMFNKKVNNLGVQKAPVGSGFENFEFFIPERRPGGQNIAMVIAPALDGFGVDNLTNGFVRPYLKSNAWVAAKEEQNPWVEMNWNQEQTIREIRLHFDTDYDHAMETIQWGHPESVMPFVVRCYRILDERGETLAEVDDNHQTINCHRLSSPVKSRKLRIEFEKPLNNVPVALFHIEVR